MIGRKFTLKKKKKTSTVFLGVHVPKTKAAVNSNMFPPTVLSFLVPQNEGYPGVNIITKDMYRSGKPGSFPVKMIYQQWVENTSMSVFKRFLCPLIESTRQKKHVSIDVSYEYSRHFGDLSM